MKNILVFIAFIAFVSPSFADTATRGVSARTSPAVNNGTNIATATKNTVIDTECQTKFNGCIDAFCITDNIDGGRCQCSTEHAKLTAELQEIKKQDLQNYRLATLGIERLETTSRSANAEIAAKTSPRKVDLSLWENKITDEKENPTGIALYKHAIEVCMEKIPECEDNLEFLQTVYNQKIKSDCTAYKNAIKEERTATETRGNDARRSITTAAYKKVQETNKYDLGQCTTEYKKCMTTTAGCGDDFKECVNIVAFENAQLKTGEKSSANEYTITGTNTQITIALSSYNVLESKKPICDSILNQCENVRDQVWGTFLRESAPQIKNAELLAESDMRTSCMANISECIVAACRDDIDPNDPDGSFDMCLSRPESVKSFCKVQIDPCEKTNPLILDYVYARLAAMRVDACTSEVKACLTDENRCGKDYTACVGLDTDTIVRMCPYDKLVGCQKVYGEENIRDEAVYDVLATMVQGIMLNIDNSLLDYCQNAVNESMIRVCGDTQSCNSVASDKYIGAGSLNYGICYYTLANDDVSIDYSKCFADVSQIRDVYLGRVEGSTTGELGPVVPLIAVLDGVMFWELIAIDDDGKITDTDEYFKLSGSTQMPEPTQELVRQQLSKLQGSISATVEAIESDPTVQYCMTGRKIRGMKELPKNAGKQEPRFPQLTDQIRKQIATSALKNAKENYYKKYDELSERQLKDYVELAERQAEIKGENAKDIRREAARQSCISLADVSSLPMSLPKKGIGMWIVAGVATIIGAVVTAVTFGAAGAPVGAGLAALWAAATSVTVPFTTLGAVAAAGVLTTAAGTAMLVGSTFAEMAADHDNGSTISMQLQLNGHHELNQWNYKQVIDTQFNWDTLNCKKCVTSQKCLKTKTPLFGTQKCTKWADPVAEECTDTQF